jgi:hypothetical protein
MLAIDCPYGHTRMQRTATHWSPQRANTSRRTTPTWSAPTSSSAPGSKPTPMGFGNRMNGAASVRHAAADGTA